MIEQDNSLTRQMQQDIAKLVELQEQQLSEDRLDRMRGVTDASFSGPGAADYLNTGGIHYSSAMAAEQAMYAAQAAPTSYASQVTQTMQQSPYSMYMADAPASFQQSYGRFQSEVSELKNLNELFNMDAYRRRSFEDQGLMFNRYGHRIGSAGVAGAEAVSSFGGYMLGSALGGGFVSSIALGTAGGAAAGFLAGQTAEELKRIQQASDYLYRESYRFIDRYESENRRYGVGFSDEQRREAASLISLIGRDNRLDFDETMGMLESFTEMGALRSVSDVESFADQFSKLIDSVKSSAISLNRSFDEVQDFMGEMKRQGIDIANFDLLSAQARVAGGYLGVGSVDMLGMGMDVVGGFARQDILFDQAVGMRDLGYTTRQVSDIFNMLEAGDPGIYDTVKTIINNKGGRSDTISFVHQGAAALLSDTMFDYLTGALEDDGMGGVRLNREIIHDLASGQLSMDELMRMGSQIDPLLADRAQGRELSLVQDAIMSEGISIPVLSEIMDMQRRQLGSPDMLFTDLLSQLNDPVADEIAKLGPLIEAILGEIKYDTAIKSVIAMDQEARDTEILSARKAGRETITEAIARTAWWPVMDATVIPFSQFVLEKAEQAGEAIERFIVGEDYRSVDFTLSETGADVRTAARDSAYDLLRERGVSEEELAEFSGTGWGNYGKSYSGMKATLAKEIQATLVAQGYSEANRKKFAEERGWDDYSREAFEAKHEELVGAMAGLDDMIAGIDSLFIEEMSATLGVLDHFGIVDRQAESVFSDAVKKTKRGKLSFDEGENYIDRARKAVRINISKVGADDILKAIGGEEGARDLGVDVNNLRTVDYEKIIDLLMATDPSTQPPTVVDKDGIKKSKIEQGAADYEDSMDRMFDAMMSGAKGANRVADALINTPMIRSATPTFTMYGR